MKPLNPKEPAIVAYHSIHGYVVTTSMARYNPLDDMALWQGGGLMLWLAFIAVLGVVLVRQALGK